MRSGFVYLITPEAWIVRDEESLRRVKIGFTARNPMVRMRDLEPGSPVALELYAYFQGSMDLERAFHAAFAPLQDKGEWFITDGKLLSFMGYLDVGGPQQERLISREKIITALSDNVFSDWSPHPSWSDEEYNATAEPWHLAKWFPEALQ